MYIWRVSLSTPSQTGQSCFFSFSLTLKDFVEYRRRYCSEGRMFQLAPILKLILIPYSTRLKASSLYFPFTSRQFIYVLYWELCVFFSFMFSWQQLGVVLPLNTTSVCQIILMTVDASSGKSFIGLSLYGPRLTGTIFRGTVSVAYVGYRKCVHGSQASTVSRGRLVVGPVNRFVSSLWIARLTPFQWALSPSLGWPVASGLTSSMRCRMMAFSIIWRITFFEGLNKGSLGNDYFEILFGCSLNTRDVTKQFSPTAAKQGRGWTLGAIVVCGVYPPFTTIQHSLLHCSVEVVSRQVYL